MDLTTRELEIIYFVVDEFDGDWLEDMEMDEEAENIRERIKEELEKRGVKV